MTLKYSSIVLPIKVIGPSFEATRDACRLASTLGIQVEVSGGAFGRKVFSVLPGDDPHEIYGPAMQGKLVSWRMSR